MKSETELREAIKERIRRASATLPPEDYPFPLYIIIEPTNRCNLSCVMCPSPSQSRPKGVMSLRLWKKIMDETAEKSPRTVIWPAIMGESLTAGENFLEMLEYAVFKRLPVVWNTNALLLSDSWIERVMNLDLREIIVGLDAATPETYGKIRRGGDFGKARENVEKMLRFSGRNTRITVQFITQDANKAETEEFKAFWLAKGAVVKIRPRLGWGDGVDAPDLILEQNERMGPCPWLMRTVSIHWNGKVAQCDGDWDQKHAAGDLNTSALEEIWKGELAERRRKHRNGDFDFEPCKNCRDWQAGLSEFYFPEGYAGKQA